MKQNIILIIFILFSFVFCENEESNFNFRFLTENNTEKGDAFTKKQVKDLVENHLEANLNYVFSIKRKVSIFKMFTLQDISAVESLYSDSHRFMSKLNLYLKAKDDVYIFDDEAGDQIIYNDKVVAIVAQKLVTKNEIYRLPLQFYFSNRNVELKIEKFAEDKESSFGYLLKSKLKEDLPKGAEIFSEKNVKFNLLKEQYGISKTLEKMITFHSEKKPFHDAVTFKLREKQGLYHYSPADIIFIEELDVLNKTILLKLVKLNEGVETEEALYSGVMEIAENFFLNIGKNKSIKITQANLYKTSGEWDKKLDDVVFVLSEDDILFIYYDRIYLYDCSLEIERLEKDFLEKVKNEYSFQSVDYRINNYRYKFHNFINKQNFQCSLITHSGEVKNKYICSFDKIFLILHEVGSNDEKNEKNILFKIDHLLKPMKSIIYDTGMYKDEQRFSTPIFYGGRRPRTEWLVSESKEYWEIKWKEVRKDFEKTIEICKGNASNVTKYSYCRKFLDSYGDNKISNPYSSDLADMLNKIKILSDEKSER